MSGTLRPFHTRMLCFADVPCVGGPGGDSDCGAAGAAAQVSHY